MLESMYEKARELGRLVGQTEEYKAVQRAQQRTNDDRELVRLVNRLTELETDIGRSLERGEDPPEPVRTEYEQAFSELQASPVYQGLIAAQSNFDRVLRRINEEIGRGMEAGAQSRIILPS